MNHKQIDDEQISRLVRAVQYKIPDHVAERVDEALEVRVVEKKRAKSGAFKSPWFWYPVSAVSTLVIIAALMSFQPFVKENSGDPGSPITEIKTEFEIKDKNIKILWVQKRDFQLNSNN